MSARRWSRTSSEPGGNRRHKPGRGFEALRYRFEIVSDYGAFRDLQRHRLLTASGSASAASSAPTFPRRSQTPAFGDGYREGLERSRAE